MARPMEKGEIALYNYNKVRYSFARIDVGEQQVLTSDPWSFLNSYLNNISARRKGENKKKVERAIYFSGLAESFYSAAENIDLPAKSTLIYYGMLDLVKCYLSLEGVPLEVEHEHHGLSLPIEKRRAITVKPRMKNAVNLFYEFSRLLGKPVKRETEVKFLETLSHVPEVHSIYKSLGHIEKSKFLPVSIEFQVNKTRDKLFTEVVFSKDQEAKCKADKFFKGARKKYLKEGFPRDGKVVYRAQRRRSFNKDNIGRIYGNILDDYSDLDIVPILTKQGYKYYVDLIPGDFTHLAYELIAMFYLGSSSRYRPLEIKELLEGDLRPLVSEFVSLSPRQFLYQMVSIITKKECVIPYAVI